MNKQLFYRGNMKKENMDIDLISRLTSLSEDIIKDL